MQINVTYDGSFASAPAGFSQAVNAAVQFYETAITSNLTLNIQFDWGELEGQALGANALAESQAANGYLLSYAQVRNALGGSIPASDPIGGGEDFFVTRAESKALGIISATDPALDGYVGLSSSYNFTYNPNNRAVAGAYDAIGTLEHEIAEVLGRISLLGHYAPAGTPWYTPLDLFRYSASSDLTPSSNTGSFSQDGTHLLLPFNNPTNGGDSGDWGVAVVGDSYGYGYTGVVAGVSATDIEVIQALGYQLGPTINGTAGNDTVVGNGGSDLIYSYGGNDLIYGGGGNVTIYAGGGNDVMVAGSGSFTAYGGTGSDYFYGGSHGDVAYGGAGGVNVFVMGSGNDQVFGGSYYSYIFGGGGNDTFHAGTGVNVINETSAGSNIIYGQGTVDYLYGGAGTDTIYGGSGETILVMGGGNSTYYGGSGTTYYYGGNGNNAYYGGSGIDVIVGGQGHDTFNGGGNVNYFFLGASAHDTVQMNANVAGVDVVHNFDPAKDLVQVLNTGWSSLSDVLAHTYDYSASAGFIDIALNGQAAIWLIGVTPSQLTPSDFHFA